MVINEIMNTVEITDWIVLLWRMWNMMVSRYQKGWLSIIQFWHFIMTQWYGLNQKGLTQKGTYYRWLNAIFKKVNFPAHPTLMHLTIQAEYLYIRTFKISDPKFCCFYFLKKHLETNGFFDFERFGCTTSEENKGGQPKCWT